MSESIYVYIDSYSSESPVLIGNLYADTLRGKEVFSFEYDMNWLNNPSSLILDPDLQLFSGRQYTSGEKNLFGVFTDSCPDRWGRLLMRRREAITAREQNRPPKKLMESDYLLGILDSARMGALRFKTQKDGPFLAEESSQSVPVWTKLRDLEEAAINIDSDIPEDKREKDWLRILVNPGSSLGGARPKATVKDTTGKLWIAKFPSRNDQINTGAWEMVIHELALRCGITVPEARCSALSEAGCTFMAKRFDRTADNRRIHFLSAMTVLGKKDGNNYSDGSSYLDIAYAIREQGSRVKHDLTELFRRILFSIAVSNSDDHLRNHGFLFEPKGLYLSPMFDVNPDPDASGLSLNIDETDNSMDFDLAINTSKYFDITKDDAAAMVKQIRSQTASWSYIAERFGISSKEIDMMSHCFRC